MRLAIPLFANITVLDAAGPYEALSRVSGVEVIVVGAEARPYASDNGMLRIHADATIDDVSSRSGRRARRGSPRQRTGCRSSGCASTAPRPRRSGS